MKLDEAVTTVRRYVDQQEAILRNNTKSVEERAKARARRLKVLRECGCAAPTRYSA